MPDTSDKIINASVRNIVTFILRTGDINSGYVSASRMQDGSRIHRQIQRMRKREAELQGFSYESEVRLKHSFEHGGFSFTVEGRADGILTRSADLPPVLEEIKSVSSDVNTAAAHAEDDGAHWHWAQAKCYAYFLCIEQSLPEIDILLTYVHVETEEMHALTRSFSATELKAFFDDLMLRYFHWAEWEYTHRRQRRESIQAGGFPYSDFRKGQRAFAAAIYRAIQQGKRLFAEAPTGTGKTMSTLFPAVKAMGEGSPNRIFYLTAKTITRQAAENAAALLARAGYDLLSIVLTAKGKICVLPECACNPKDCPRAGGHFDRVNDAVWDVITNERQIGRETVEAYAEKHLVCPHELGLDISLWADMIVGDYNYAFDPNASLKRFFGEHAEKDDFVFLIDEAHNLVERAREMFSSVLYKDTVLRLRQEIKGVNTALYRALGKINSFLLEAAKSIPPGQTSVTTHTPPEELCKHLTDFVKKAEEFLAERGGADDMPTFLELYFDIMNFLGTYEFFGEQYAVYTENTSGISLRLMCLDPSARLAHTLEKTTSAIFFSATLTPLPYFRQSLGGGETDLMCRLPSPFAQENLCVAIDRHISTRYKDRENSYDAIAARLAEMCRAKKGNYFAFFSSYAYLRNVLERFTATYPDIEALVQQQNMSEPERENFLLEFESPRESSLLAFAVMGGMFSEGIDLVGESLIGAAVVGVGLPLVSEERDVVARYYDKTYGEGFAYAYMYPGMNKVMQAAGRVIRTETDRGVLLFIDDRFLTPRYEELFPDAWRHYHALRPTDNWQDMLTAFWEHK